MIDSYRCIYKGGIGEVIEKKSRFIATISSVDKEEDALEFIAQTKKIYKDANHNCSAYTIGLSDEIKHCSDDGEPAKTAGYPILDVLLGEKIHNVAVVVTRYFGGTLLGTGGLVRAYQGATKEGLNNSIIIDKKQGKKVLIETDYTGLGKIQYQMATLSIPTIDITYTDIVKLTVLVPCSIIAKFIEQITQVTLGKAFITELENIYYAHIENEIIIFTNNEIHHITL